MKTERGTDTALAENVELHAKVQEHETNISSMLESLDVLKFASLTTDLAAAEETTRDAKQLVETKQAQIVELEQSLGKELSKRDAISTELAKCVHDKNAARAENDELRVNLRVRNGQLKRHLIYSLYRARVFCVMSLSLLS